MLFDRVQKRKLKSNVNNDNYKMIYEIILNYEKIAGTSDVTKKIKNYSIYNMINNEFINTKLLEKI
jgi:hypothetical protein